MALELLLAQQAKPLYQANELLSPFYIKLIKLKAFTLLY